MSQPTVRPGYRTVIVNGKPMPEHRWVAERVLGGSLPKGAVVHHLNSDPSDNRPQNLVICHNSKYHDLLHVRTRALRASGNANYRKCRNCGEWGDPATLDAGSIHPACRRPNTMAPKLPRTPDNNKTVIGTRYPIWKIKLLDALAERDGTDRARLIERSLDRLLQEAGFRTTIEKAA